MNLHITPSFIIDRLCKTASVLLFLVTLDIHVYPVIFKSASVFQIVQVVELHKTMSYSITAQTCVCSYLRF